MQVYAIYDPLSSILSYNPGSDCFFSKNSPSPMLETAITPLSK